MLQRNCTTVGIQLTLTKPGYYVPMSLTLWVCPYLTMSEVRRAPRGLQPYVPQELQSLQLLPDCGDPIQYGTVCVLVYQIDPPGESFQ